MKKVVKFKDRTYLKAEKLEEEGRSIIKQISEMLLPEGGVNTPEELLYYVLKTTHLTTSLIQDLGEVSGCPAFDKSEKEHFIDQVNGGFDRILEALQEARTKNNA